MATSQGLKIVLLILCITCVTQTAPLKISFPDPQHELTKRMNESLKEVKWGCRNGTKCFGMMKLVKEIAENRVKLDCAKGFKYENIDLVREIAEMEVKWSCAKETKFYEPNELWIALFEKTGMTTTTPMKRKNQKGKRAKKLADDMLKEKL